MINRSSADGLTQNYLLLSTIIEGAQSDPLDLFVVVLYVRSSRFDLLTLTIYLLFIEISRENRKFSGNFSYRGKKKKENRKFSGMTRDVIGFKME